MYFSMRKAFREIISPSEVQIVLSYFIYRNSRSNKVRCLSVFVCIADVIHGEPVTTPDRDPQGCQILGPAHHGGLYVLRRSERVPGAAASGYIHSL